MRTMKRMFGAILVDFLLFIPISAILAGIAIFFTNVVFGGSLGFIVLWKWIYLVPFGLAGVIDLVLGIYRCTSILAVAKRIKRPFRDIEEALLDYRLDKTCPISEWTGEWFDGKLQSARAVNTLAEALAMAMLSH